MTTKPARCCVLTQRGTRCANEPSPVRPSRMIGPVRLAACGLEAHQRALWSLPGFVRHDAYCGAFGCDRPSNAGICQKHRDMYRDFGITEHMLLAPQEAPMTEPTPPSKLPELGFPRVQIQASSASLADLEAAATGMTIPTPPAAPQEAAGGGATSDDPRVWDDARWALCYSRDSGFAPALWFSVAKEEQEVYMRVVMERMAKAATPSPEAPKPACTAIGGESCVCYAREGDCPHMPGNVDYTVGILDRATAPGTDGESDGEPSAGDVDDAYSGRWGQYAALVQPMSPELAAIAAPVQPTAPGPTLAEVQAELAAVTAERDRYRSGAQSMGRLSLDWVGHASGMVDQFAALRVELARERERADRAEMDAVAERARADEALESLEELRDMRSTTRDELHAVCLLMQRLGSYGPDAPAMLMRLLPVESRRALLEIEAADARGELARARANVVNPPTPEKLAEAAAKVAEVEARIAALDAGDVRG